MMETNPFNNISRKLLLLYCYYYLLHYIVWCARTKISDISNEKRRNAPPPTFFIMLHYILHPINSGKFDMSKTEST